MWKRGWTSLRNILEAGIRQRVTRIGLLFTIAIIMVALAAFVSANNLLFLLFAMMLAAFLLSGFVSRLTLAGLGLEFTLPDHISARRKTPARITVFNDKTWMTSFSLHLSGVQPSAITSTLYFPAIPSHSSLRGIVKIEFSRRGVYKESGIEFSTRFPFGFTERRVQVVLRRDVLVYPSLEPQPGFEELLSSISGELESNQPGRGSDFYRIRPYETTESARHVDWKATAHTGDLQVREFARDQDPLVEIFLDLHVPQGREDWFENVVDCCAFLVWNASREECRMRFRTQEFDMMLPAEGDAHSVLTHLALVSGNSAESLPAPGGDGALELLFTSRPQLSAESGWETARVLHPANFPPQPGLTPMSHA
jgi:uncharacterized protein (DUF58 family)